MARTSVKSAAAAARRDEAKALKGTPSLGAVSTMDSFTNLAQKMGLSANNASSTSSYGFNPLSRNRVLLEWIYRGSWIAGRTVDAVADDMTRAGVDYVSEMPPDDIERIDSLMVRLNTWPSINDTIKWGRLYGGALGVVMMDGQDFKTPLKVDATGRGQYRGILPLDRWMVEPSTDDLVTELGPHVGYPKYYRVMQSAPALRGLIIHHTRVAFRIVGVELPYQQRLTENMWGMSVIERLYDRLLAFDSASTGAAQLVYKAFLRTMTVDGMRDIVAAGGKPLEGLVKYMEMMRQYQGNEGITLIDGKDKFEMQSNTAFSGLDSTLTQFAGQLSGASEMPLVRLFGQSPGGLGSNGESEMRNYYDAVNQKQMRDLHRGVTLAHQLGALSLGIKLPTNFAIDFRSLWELTEGDKANIAKTGAETVNAAMESGLISQKTAMQELRQQSRVTGVFTNITHEMIEKADDTAEPPQGETDPIAAMLGGGGPTSPPGGDDTPENVAPGQLPSHQGVMNGTSGPQGTQGEMDKGTNGGSGVQQPTPRRRPTNRGDSPGDVT